MASCIRYLPKRKQLLFDFIDNSVDGDATVFDFDTGNRGYIFKLIKNVATEDVELGGPGEMLFGKSGTALEGTTV